MNSVGTSAGLNSMPWVQLVGNRREVLKNHSSKKIVVHTILTHNSMGFY